VDQALATAFVFTQALYLAYDRCVWFTHVRRIRSTHRHKHEI